MGVSWLAMIVLWSFLANLLEGKGINVFLEIWLNSVALFLVNIYCLAEIIKHQEIELFEIIKWKRF